jgi:hypothetical protein
MKIRFAELSDEEYWRATPYGYSMENNWPGYD